MSQMKLNGRLRSVSTVNIPARAFLPSQLGYQLRPARTHRNHLPQRSQTRGRRVRNP